MCVDDPIAFYKICMYILTRMNNKLNSARWENNKVSLCKWDEDSVGKIRQRREQEWGGAGRKLKTNTLCQQTAERREEVAEG